MTPASAHTPALEEAVPQAAGREAPASAPPSHLAAEQEAAAGTAGGQAPRGPPPEGGRGGAELISADGDAATTAAKDLSHSRDASGTEGGDELPAEEMEGGGDEDDDTQARRSSGGGAGAVSTAGVELGHERAQSLLNR